MIRVSQVKTGGKVRGSEQEFRHRGMVWGRAIHVGEVKKDSCTGGRHVGPCRPWVRSLVITDVVRSHGRISAKWETQYDLHFEETSLNATCGK